MATRKTTLKPSVPPVQPKLAPVVEEITIQQAQRIMSKQGFSRLIHVSRDPVTGRIVDLILREA